MIKRKKLLLLLLLWYQTNTVEAQVQPDTIITKTTETLPEEPRLKIEPEKKRQRNRTGITVFVSCLFIISTTILLYNVRSK